MRFEVFKNKFINLPIITTQHLNLLTNNNQILKNQLTRWKKKKKIIQLKRNYYILNQIDRKINPSKQYLAYELYKPSYISLEYALSFYEIIPERTIDVTSITTKKPTSITNSYANFIYQHIKTECFTGYIKEKDEEGLNYYISLPEKAVTDFIYLNLNKFNNNYMDVLFDSYRFQNIDVLKKRKLLKFSKGYNNKKLDNIIKSLCMNF